MDLLYSRYASPMDLMKLYMEQGRFGEFVTEILDMDFKRKQAEENKENEGKLWSMYIHSMSAESFNDWKERVMKEAPKLKRSSRDVNMTGSDVEGIINRLFPNK